MTTKTAQIEKLLTEALRAAATKSGSTGVASFGVEVNVYGNEVSLAFDSETVALCYEAGDEESLAALAEVTKRSTEWLRRTCAAKYPRFTVVA